MPLKTAGIICIALGILLCGKEVEERTAKRLKELEEFHRFLGFLEQEITCRQTVFSSVLEKAHPLGSGCLRTFIARLKDVPEYGHRPMNELWDQAVRQTYGPVGLKQEELQIMRQTGTAFLCMQRGMIGNRLRTDREQLGHLIEARRDCQQKDSHLYRSLSIMASLLAVLILI
ncbi:MAG: stage III sporulation protein AB [Lachnospiraceae bacterium]|nr:stage III sporulation protein AB [Lachnospiraceae bacterium]